MSETKATFFPQRLDAKTTKKVVDFLFDFGRESPTITDTDKIKAYRKQNSRELEAKTYVKGPRTFQMLAYYGVLRDSMDIENAMIISDSFKRLFIANNGLGRDQATIIMRGGLPKEFEVRTGQL